MRLVPRVVGSLLISGTLSAILFGIEALTHFHWVVPLLQQAFAWQQSALFLPVGVEVMGALLVFSFLFFALSCLLFKPKPPLTIHAPFEDLRDALTALVEYPCPRDRVFIIVYTQRVLEQLCVRGNRLSPTVRLANQDLLDAICDGDIALLAIACMRIDLSILHARHQVSSYRKRCIEAVQQTVTEAKAEFPKTRPSRWLAPRHLMPLVRAVYKGDIDKIDRLRIREAAFKKMNSYTPDHPSEILSAISAVKSELDTWPVESSLYSASYIDPLMAAVEAAVRDRKNIPYLEKVLAILKNRHTLLNQLDLLRDLCSCSGDAPSQIDRAKAIIQNFPHDKCIDEVTHLKPLLSAIRAYEIRSFPHVEARFRREITREYTSRNSQRSHHC